MTPRPHLHLHAAVVVYAIAAPIVLIAQGGRSVPAPPPQGPVPAAVTFTDVTASAGIRFHHNSGAFGRKYLPETMGSGAAVLDVDADGWQDVFFVNGTRFPGRPALSGPNSVPTATALHAIRVPRVTEVTPY